MVPAVHKKSFQSRLIPLTTRVAASADFLAHQYIGCDAGWICPDYLTLALKYSHWQNGTYIQQFQR